MRCICVVLMLVFLAGCRNYRTWETTYDKEGKVTSVSGSEYASKFTKKSVSVLTEVEAFKVTTAPDASGSLMPQVNFGWFWTAFMDILLQPGGEFLFVKTNSHWMVNNTSGTTLLYIKNGTDSEQNVSVKSKPKFMVDLPFVKFGAGSNKTDVSITPKDKVEGKPLVIAHTTGGNVVNITKPPPENNNIADKLTDIVKDAKKK